MVRKNINSRYRRERALLPLISPHLQPVPFSGGAKFADEDGVSEHLIVQAKSTEGQGIRVVYDDIYALAHHANTVQVPLFLLDFAKPRHGVAELPDEQWIAMPLWAWQKLRQYVECDGFTSEEVV